MATAHRVSTVILIFILNIISSLSLSLVKREVGTVYSLQEQEAILEAHNEFRRNADPMASDMQEMKWDDILATQAQSWADTCVLEHPDTTIHGEYDGIGQNLYAIFNFGENETPEPNTTESIESWQREVGNYTYESNVCDEGASCSHYTQVVWADTTSVGCGISYCPEGVVYYGITLPKAWIVVCDYSPGGNIIGEKPYESGENCTKCSDGKPCKSGLCTDCSLTNDPGCECKIHCNNGFLYITGDKCECSCSEGYTGEFCEDPCEDKHEYCGGNPGWPASWCTPEYPYVLENCPVLCELC